MESVRQERANAEIIKALSYILRNKVNDPRIKNLFITLTYVKQHLILDIVRLVLAF